MRADGRTDVLAVGEVLAAFSTPVPLRVGCPTRFTFVGAESNVAIGLARLGHRVAFAGAVGDDTLALKISDALRGEGVDCTHLRVDPERPTGMVVFDAPIHGVRRVTYARKGSAGSALASSEVAALRETAPRVLHVSGVTLALGRAAVETVYALLESAHDMGVTVSFDVNFRNSLWSREEAAPVIREVGRRSDILFGSGEELALVVGDEVTPSALAALPPARVILKRGADGASEFSSGARHDSPSVTRQILDPVGAGDAFAAGYLSGFLDGRNSAESLARGHEVAAFALGNEGDWEGLPRRSELPLTGVGTDVVR